MKSARGPGVEMGKWAAKEARDTGHWLPTEGEECSTCPLCGKRAMEVGRGIWISMNMLTAGDMRLEGWYLGQGLRIHKVPTQDILFNLPSKQRNVNENKAIPFCTYQLAKITGKENSAGEKKRVCAQKMSFQTFDLRVKNKIQHNHP